MVHGEGSGGKDGEREGRCGGKCRREERGAARALPSRMARGFAPDGGKQRGRGSRWRGFGEGEAEDVEEAVVGMRVHGWVSPRGARAARSVFIA